MASLVYAVAAFHSVAAFVMIGIGAYGAIDSQKTR